MWLLASCLYVSDEELARRVAEGTIVEDSGGDTSVDPLVLSDLSVDWGLTSGGLELVIEGSGFLPEAKVWFGTKPATILSVEATQITLLTPEFTTEGVATVRVDQNGESASLEQYFDYYEEGEGKLGLSGALFTVNFVGGYWTEPAQTVSSLYLRFVRPIADYTYWKNWSPELDTCASNADPGYVFDPYDLAKLDPDVSLTVIDATGERSASLPWSASYGGFVLDPLHESLLATTRGYNIPAFTAVGFPEMEVDNLFTTAGAWTVESPLIGGANQPKVSREGISLVWSGEGGEAMIMNVGLESAGGLPLQEEFYCAMVDDGEFTIPAELTSDWPVGRSVHLMLGRYLPNTGTVSFNHAIAGAPAVNFQYGAVELQ